jgi:hypothetical protein
MSITRAKLREIIRGEFGAHLERVTPAGAREFLERLYREFHAAAHPNGTIEIRESAHSYEEIMAEFFSSTLDIPAEDAAVMLWLWAFEQHFTAMEAEYTERFMALFERLEITEKDNE